LDLKIPFLSGEEWKITQGYDGDGWGSGKPTHNSSSKDRFALDFSLSGESDYNKQVLAVADGIVSIKESKVVNKITGVVEYTGYGKYVDIDHGDDIISRYAHFVNFAVEDGEIVKQGQLIGYLDSTGYSSGSHLHFAMYQKDANGNLTPYKPEPMSGYTDFKAGEWYVSDNELYDPNKKVEESTEQPQQKSWWQKVKEVFSFGDGDVNSENTQELKDVFQNTNQNLEFEIKTAEAEKTYSLNFLNSNQTIEIEPGGESNLQVKVKNVGTATWEKKNISANVVGGLSANNEYHHQTWVTSLRPALLDQNTLEPNQSGSFSFKINAPTKPGQYTFKIQVVRTDNNFSPVSGGYWSVNLQVKEKELVIENKVEKEVKENIEIKKDSGIKIIEEVKEVFNNVKETVKEFFYSSGSSSSGSSNNNQDESQSDSNNENLPEVFIISPTSSKYTNISTATISGTKNEFTEFVYINTTTANIISSTTWEKEINLGEGSNSFQIWGENEEGKKQILI
jgi:murein DD-endopeptidase MepM/ murein hydrolase activator NlpD